MSNKIFSIETPPKRMAKTGDDFPWSVAIILISGNVRRRGYYDPHGSIAGGKYFYFRKHSIEDCADLKNFPTHWQYASNPFFGKL
jgi:hypothetical protein